MNNCSSPRKGIRAGRNDLLAMPDYVWLLYGCSREHSRQQHRLQTMYWKHMLVTAK